MINFKTIIISIIIIIISISVFTKKSYSWSLFDLFQNINNHKSNQNKLEQFDPVKDITILPHLNNKPLFEAVSDLSICRRRNVRKYIYLYLTKGRKYLIKSFEKSNLYIDIIEDIFNDNPDMPKDLSLLPILESGFNPYAVSRSKAVGLWQFLKNTSRALGLRTDRWVDERRDIEKSTIAAIRHLRSLYGIFRSWELALTAYNGGSGHVKRSMLKTGAKNYWELAKSGALKRETEQFLPRMAALLVIYKNQWIFDITDEIEDKNTIKTENIILNFPVSIHQVSKISGVSIKTIKIYNPELKKKITPPYYRKYSLRLPVGAREKVEKNINKLYKLRFKKMKRHIVKKGECIIRIAKQYKIKPRTIIILNDIKKPRLIHPGLKLYIPI